ncbi:hypothetical protein LZC95_08285 [Pendulispora brunnea]|uniref:PEGA domain-containing protein n=1 Tax=Pendulispora brunnea TaxID=2905690 RepID=A0ABZ2KHN9_9BACT
MDQGAVIRYLAAPSTARRVRAILSALLLTWPHLAFAQATSPSRTDLKLARDLFAKVEADEAAGRWDAALEKLARIAGIKVTAGILFHTALCEERLGRLVAAQEDYKEAQTKAREDGNASVAATAREHLDALGPRVPSLTIAVEPISDGVEVYLDGNLIPLRAGSSVLQVDPGPREVRVQAPGMKKFTTTRIVGEGERATIKVQLESMVLPVVLVPAPAATPAPTPREGFWTTGHTVAVSLFGLGLLATTGGVAFTLASNGSASEGDRLRTQLPPSTTCAQPTDPTIIATCGRLRDAQYAHDNQATMARGFFIAGGAFVATGVVVWLVWPKDKPNTERVVLRPTFDVHARAVGLQGTF